MSKLMGRPNKHECERYTTLENLSLLDRSSGDEY